jgi:hypothetical protein
MALDNQKENQATTVISVDLDDRAFLFPETRNIAQLRFSAQSHSTILLEFVFAHNVSRLAPVSILLQFEDAKSLCMRLIDAVYRAQTQNVITDSARISITMATNGYILTIEETGNQRQFYMSTVSIWRVCNALCRLVDMQSPILSN